MVHTSQQELVTLENKLSNLSQYAPHQSMLACGPAQQCKVHVGGGCTCAHEASYASKMLFCAYAVEAQRNPLILKSGPSHCRRWRVIVCNM